MELCGRFLDKKAQLEIAKLSLAPPRTPQKASSALIEKWNDGERALRLALAKLRAEKLNKSFNAEIQSFPAGLLQAARTAIEIESPMEAEKFLNRYRLDFLETLRPLDSFSEEFIFYFWLKLKLLLRIRQFDAERGEASYRSIYDSIISRDRSEVM